MSKKFTKPSQIDEMDFIDLMEEFEFTEENKKKIKEWYTDETLKDYEYVDKVISLAKEQIKFQNKIENLN